MAQNPHANQDYVPSFEQVMAENSLTCPNPLTPNGQIQRYEVPGDKPGSRNGWYVLYDDGNNPTIVFGSWKTGQTIKRSFKNPQVLSPIERKLYQRRIAQAQEQAERERKINQQEAAVRALAIWEKSSPALVDHPYLIKKQIQPYGVRASRGGLVIPAYDESGAIATLQFIKEDGTKRFLSHGVKAGNYFALGEPGEHIYVVEGFATGATVREVTGNYTVVAFDAGNLKSVAERIKAEYPESKIVVCADNDVATEGNPGLTKAREAAAVGGDVVYPVFKNTSTNGKPTTDFNDLFVSEGGEAVRAQLQSIEKPELTLKDAILNYSCLMSLKLPERKTLYPWLPVGGIAMNYGPRGVGKTFFNMALAASLCTGSRLFSWDAPAQTGVLYCDGEMDLEQLRTRATGLLQDPPKAPLSFLTSQYVYEKLQSDFKLSEASVRDDLTAILDSNPAIRVLILDNISCLFSGIDEDSKQAWEPIAAWLVRLRHRGITTILSHHGGKSGQQRGTSGREDALDSVIRLSLPAGYVQTEGCHFHVSFEKCRSGKGQDLEPLDCKLEEKDGTLVWTHKALTLSNEELAARHFAEGIESPSDLATEMGITRGYASKLLKKLRAQRQGGTP